ncbi:MAG TPA: Stk1 family PASTA domain-containing Ser/Thr kinase [Actinomycetota bacterium]|nr:Stk1 family PASTA domain-containing Ser/Thr kinase [Actinomycetota bacterium]
MEEKRERVLAGRYRIESAVGEGGMAKVFRGQDVVLGRTVAVKVLAPEYARDGRFVERFRREAQSAAALSHPNVVSVFDTGSDGPVHYIVMEFLEGRTLREVLAADGRLHPDRAAEIAESMCRALATAHHHGLVHRDVKPGNVMLTPSGEVKVMDFGIARVTTGEALTQTATVLGTASYFSPEQAKGEGVDPRSDVYSAGCVLYEMLTGRPPFTGDSPVSIAYKHVREDAPVPSSINPDVSTALDAVVMKALAKNPANRYQTAVEMAEDLHRVREGAQVLATPILPGQPTEVVNRPVRHTEVMPALPEEERRERGPWPVVLVTALVVALVGVAGFLLVRELTAEVPQVRVPNVVGSEEGQATQLLERRGFRVDPIRVASTEDPGIVLEQDPPAGELVDEGEVVILRVSAAPEPVMVPDITQMTVGEARAALAEVDLEIGATPSEASDEVEEGLIISQSPAPEEEAPAGSAVDVVVSSGPETVEVPNVICDDLEVARDKIRGAGLKLKRGTPENSDVCPDPGTIARTDPVEGELVRPGSTVMVFESLGPSITPSPPVTISPSPSPTL